MTDDCDWSTFSTPAERAEAAIAVAAEMAAYKRHAQRREEARQLRLAKAALRAGLPVKAATIGGVALEFGQPAPAEPLIAAGDVNEWDLDLGTHPPETRQ